MAKRNKDVVNISDVLSDFVGKNKKIESGLEKVQLTEAWHKQLGAGVSGYTTAIDFKKDTLFVKLSSSVLRQELSYGKEKIIAMLNQAVGKQLVKKLVLR